MSKMRKWLTVLCVLLIIANLAFIWGNSLLPGNASREVSGGALNGLFRFFIPIFGEKAEKILRKVAHFSEFGSLGFLLTAAFLLPGKKTIVPPMLLGILAACVDETIQLYVPGRTSSVVDVWIDFLGVLTGIAVSFLISWCIIRYKRRKRK